MCIVFSFLQSFSYRTKSRSCLKRMFFVGFGFRSLSVRKGLQEGGREWLVCLCGMQNSANREAVSPKAMCGLQFSFLRAAAPVFYPFTEPQGGGGTVARQGCIGLPVLSPGKDPELRVRFPAHTKKTEFQSGTANPSVYIYNHL